MHFSNKQRQRTRRPGCDAKPHSTRPPAAAERIPCLSKHSSGNLRCRNALKHLLASHRENHGPGKEEHVLILAGLQDPGQSIPPCTDAEVLWGGCYKPETNALLYQKAALGPARNPTSSKWVHHCPRGHQ